MTWADLSDDELKARLVNRGVPAELARLFVLHRDDPATIDHIELAMEER